MSLYPGINPFAVILNQTGGGLNGGLMYIGQPNQDPQTHPKEVFWDTDGTDLASQPLTTVGGYVWNSGTPAQFYVDGTYSIRILDRYGRQVLYEPEASSFISYVQDYIGTDIRQNTTINSDDFSSLDAMFAWINARRIRPNAELSVFIADGIYTPSQIIWDHPDGQQVKIFGNTADKAAVKLQFDATVNKSGFFIRSKLGFIDWLQIYGVGARVNRTTWNADCYGGGIVTQGSGAHALVGGNVQVFDFFYGYLADKTGSMIVQNGSEAFNAGDAGFHAREGSSMVCRGTKCFTAAAIVGSEAFGSGHAAELGSSMDCGISYATDCEVAGVTTSGNSAVWAQGFWAEDNNLYGAVSFGGYLHFGIDYGTLAAARATNGNGIGVACFNSGNIIMPHTVAHQAVVTGNGGDGIFVYGDGAVLSGDYAIVTGNTGWGGHALEGGRARFLSANFAGNTAGTTTTDSGLNSSFRTS